MLRLSKDKSLDDLKEHGFKWGTREKFEYKTTHKGIESKIYIDCLPCHNNNNEIHIESNFHSLPEKIANKLFDLIEAGLIEKV